MSPCSKDTVGQAARVLQNYLISKTSRRVTSQAIVSVFIEKQGHMVVLVDRTILLGGPTVTDLTGIAARTLLLVVGNFSL
ncbi:hypothetical protein P40_14900 [Alloalcanivorax xenomutans]|nr:hypothetical protein P40_14900 [Alloalcanivorax xenomutans]ERS12832.1 hypothetical protein Q668_16990 [Alcanivorax sp. PN-3]KYZ86883.1 hypothetical protein A3Q32_15090 [Alcanivorax sp. KX64203]